MEYMDYKKNWRDKLAYTLATWVLTRVATKNYCNWITALKNMGLTNVQNELYSTASGSTVYEMPAVSRVTVVVKEREFEKYYLKDVELHFQDNGRTIKVFANEQE